MTKGRECLHFDGDPDGWRRLPHASLCGDWAGLYNLPGAGNNRFSWEWAYGSACKPLGLQDPRRGPLGRADGHLVPPGRDVHHRRPPAVLRQRCRGRGRRGPGSACIEDPIPQYTRLGTDSNGKYLDGQIDEVRVSFAARAADWIATGYNNQSAPYVGAGGFYSSIAHSAGPWSVTATACPALNPCAGGPGTCYLRSIGNTADYTTGSPACTATNGSSVVSCPGAGWQSANRGRGDRILIDGTNYMVLAVDSESQLRLSTPFTGTTGVGNKSYTMSRQFATPKSGRTASRARPCARLASPSPTATSSPATAARSASSTRRAAPTSRPGPPSWRSTGPRRIRTIRSRSPRTDPTATTAWRAPGSSSTIRRTPRSRC